jgi:antitoxin VapB
LTKIPDYRGIAKVFWSGRSQAVRLPAACRFATSEVEVIKEGDQVTLRPRGKNWAAYLDSDSRGSLPQRQQPPLEERDEFG